MPRYQPASKRPGRFQSLLCESRNRPGPTSYPTSTAAAKPATSTAARVATAKPIARDIADRQFAVPMA